MVDMNLINRGFNLSVLQLHVEVFKELDSTNLEAKRRISKGIEQDLLIVSSRQTSGRGRYNRTWFSPEGGLYFSLVVRPRLGPQFAPLSGLLCACAVAEGLQSLGVEGVSLKWPNDVLIRNDKVAGILSELVTLDPIEHWIILGVGINQNSRITNFPEAISYTATSVYDQMNSIDFWLSSVESEKSFDSVLAQWKQISSTLGRKVRITDSSRTFVGIAKDLCADGSLLVDLGEETIKVTMGDVTYLRQD